MSLTPELCLGPNFHQERKTKGQTPWMNEKWRDNFAWLDSEEKKNVTFDLKVEQDEKQRCYLNQKGLSSVVAPN